MRVTTPTTAPPPVAPGHAAPAGPPAAPARAPRRDLPRPSAVPTTAWVVLACAALAALSVLIAPTPSYDPWAWIIWGRELTGLSDLGFTTAAATGWKPLPVLATTPLSLLGPDLAPAAWVAVVRTAALLALILVGRTAHRAAGWPAAAAAVAFLLVSPQALELVTGGASEAVVLVLVLYGIWCHLDERPGRALAAGIAAALARPESVALVLPYAIWLWREDLVPRGRIAGGLLLLPLFWVGGDWLGSGRPLLTFGHATSSVEPNRVQSADVPGFELLVGTGHILAPIVVVLALFAAVDAVRRRERVGVALAAAVAALTLPLTILTELGYPGVPRYLSAPAGLACVLAGIGVVRAVALLRTRRRARPAIAAVLTASVALAVLAGAPELEGSWALYTARVGVDRTLPAAIAAAGGREGVLACGRPVIRPSYLGTDLAYRLDVPMRAVNSGGPGPAVVFFPRHGVSWRDFTQAWGPWLALARIARTSDWDVLQLRDTWTAPCAVAAAGNLGPVVPEPPPPA